MLYIVPWFENTKHDLPIFIINPAMVCYCNIAYRINKVLMLIIKREKFMTEKL